MAHSKAKEDSITQLYKAFMTIKSEAELKRFMADIMTPGEIAAFAERWEIARLLDKGDMSYRDIAAATGASTTTVARVARFLNQEPHQGYKLVLERMKSS